MPKCFMDNILKGVLCACVIASGCGMNKGNKDELETILNDFFRKNTWWSNEENRGDLLRKIKNMTLSELAGSGFECVRKLKKGIFRFDDSCWPIETIDLKKDYIRNDDIFRELTSLNTLAKDLKIKSVQDLKGKTFRFDDDYTAREINLGNYIKKSDLANYPIAKLAELGIGKVRERLSDKIVRFNEGCYPQEEINPKDYVKKKDLEDKGLEYLAETLGIKSVKELKGKTFSFSGYEMEEVNSKDYVEKENLTGKELKYLAEDLRVNAVAKLKKLKINEVRIFDDDYKATKVDLEDYVRKGDLEKESLFLLGNLYKVGAVEELKGLKTDEGVKIFNDNYEFNDAVKTLVKKENANLDDYINKEDLKKKDLSYLATELKVDAVAKLNELETDEGVKIFNNYVFNDEVKGLVNKETGDTNPTNTSSTTPHAGGCCRYP